MVLPLLLLFAPPIIISFWLIWHGFMWSRGIPIMVGAAILHLTLIVAGLAWWRS